MPGEKDFENVSIRELAAAANVNVAAVNYHFQGKENLFLEVVQRRFVAQRDRTLAALDALLKKDRSSEALVKMMNIHQGARYIEIMAADPGQERFARGWIRRA